jgi:hypothetical protein
MSSNRPGDANSAHPRHLSRSRRNRTRVITLVLSAAPLLCATPAAPALATASRPASPASPPPVSLASPVATPAAAPATTALQQLDWLIDASARPPISTAELDQHLTPQLLAAAGGPAGLTRVCVPSPRRSPSRP